jgi:hypothetical protein
MGGKALGNILKIELRRAFKNPLLLIALAVGAAVALGQFIQVVLPAIPYLDTYKAVSKGGIIYPHSVFNKWMGSDSTSVYSLLFYILMPILVTLPFADSFFCDRKSGYIKNVLIRTPKSRYYIAKYIAVFLSAGTAGIVPLLLNLGLSSAVLPSLLPQITDGTFPLMGTSMWAGLFYTHPYLYTGAYLAVDFVFFGLLACIALAVSFFAEYRFMVLLAPFLFYLFVLSFLNLTGLSLYSPFYFLRPNQPYLNLTFGIIALESAALLLFTAGMFFGKGLHDDTY